MCAGIERIFKTSVAAVHLSNTSINISPRVVRFCTFFNLLKACRANSSRCSYLCTALSPKPCQRELCGEQRSGVQVLDIDPTTVTSLESYLEEYYTRILKKLKEVGATSKQTDFYV